MISVVQNFICNNDDRLKVLLNSGFVKYSYVSRKIK